MLSVKISTQSSVPIPHTQPDKIGRLLLHIPVYIAFNYYIESLLMLLTLNLYYVASSRLLTRKVQCTIFTSSTDGTKSLVEVPS
jgi:hypothetical protein